MVYYADYEALEFNNSDALKSGIYPYYLNPKLTETSLCPIFFAVANAKGDIRLTQDCFKRKISFLSFLDGEIKKYQRAEHKILKVWFHYVKYDFRIIVHELFYNNFIHIMDSEKITYEGEYETRQDKSFAIVGENLSKYIGINIYYKGFKILIRDTMSILNSAQDKILKEFGFKLKVDVNWETITIENLKENMDLIEERCTYDVSSLAQCIEQFKTLFYEKFGGKGSTAAGMSLDALKVYLCKTLQIEDINYEVKKEVFREFYPPLSGWMKDLSKGCYSGAICLVNEKYRGQLLEKLQMADINSSYPYSMTMPLPYGEGKEIYDFTDEGYSEYVVYIDFKHKGVPFQRCHTENKARMILGYDMLEKGKTYTRSQYPESFKGYLCINNIDLQTLERYANIRTLDFKKGVNYKTTTIVRDFIIPIYEERKLSKGVLKLAIKLILNSLYGKYAQDLSGIVFAYLDMENYNKVIAIDNDTIYKPFASAVIAYSRQNWTDTVYLLGDNFVYGDTDSVYFINYKESLEILEKAGKLHENELGKWALEEEYGKYIEKAKFLSKKNYVIQINGKLKVTCVGLSHKYHNQVTFDNFKIDNDPYKIYKMVNIYGGKAMRQTEFKIKERSNY